MSESDPYRYRIKLWENRWENMGGWYADPQQLSKDAAGDEWASFDGPPLPKESREEAIADARAVIFHQVAVERRHAELMQSTEFIEMNVP